MDTHAWVLWVGVIAASLHVIEEYSLGWIAWANDEVGSRLGVEITKEDFFLTNLALVFIALAGAAIGWWAPAVSLAVPALFVINALVFHMLPTARADRITPGTITAVFVYLPVAAWMFWAAGADGHLSFGTFILAFVLGAVLMGFPLLMLYLKNRIGWEAGDAAATLSDTGYEEQQSQELPFGDAHPTSTEPVDEATAHTGPATSIPSTDKEDAAETNILAETPDPIEQIDEPDTEERSIELYDDAATEFEDHDDDEDETAVLNRD